MAYLPQLTILGRLKTIEVYEFYDIPRLFSCRNASGQHYLALSIDENDFSQTWLYVALSQERFQELRTGQLELRDAYLNAENEMVFKVITYQDHHDLIELVYCTDIPEDWLPLAGEVLSSSFDAALTPNEIGGDLRTQLAS
jgi:hypothetical protein